MDETSESIHAFEALFVNNPTVADIEAYLSRFNPIRVMKMERMEIRHSSILGWLLDPKESHGFGDSFLKAFLAAAYSGRSGEDKISALDILREDFGTARIRVEWKNIDIFVHLEREDGDWAFVVENKIDSVQHSDQLNIYYKKIEGYLNENAKICGVFLSLYDEPVEHPAYAPIGYDEVVSLLEDTLARSHTNEQVSIFIGHYCNILREVTHMSSEATSMVKLARQLYRDHRKVIDFIVTHGSDTEFGMAMRSVFGDEWEGKKEREAEIDSYWYELGSIRKDRCDFLPVEWTAPLYKDPKGKQIKWILSQDYWLNYPITCWFEIQQAQKGTGGKLTLFGEVGPIKSNDVRVGLIDLVKLAAKNSEKLKIGFRRDATQEGRKFARFYKGNSVDIKDVHDPEAIAAKARQLLEKFRPEFDAIGVELSNAFKLVGEES